MFVSVARATTLDHLAGAGGAKGVKPLRLALGPWLSAILVRPPVKVQPDNFVRVQRLIAIGAPMRFFV